MNYESWQRDPQGIDEPHDILAADEFGIGTRDERLPPDPNRFGPPHDILAAEEFPMPVGGTSPAHQSSGPNLRRLLPLALLVAFAAFLAARRR